MVLEADRAGVLVLVDAKQDVLVTQRVAHLTAKPLGKLSEVPHH